MQQQQAPSTIPPPRPPSPPALHTHIQWSYRVTWVLLSSRPSPWLRRRYFQLGKSWQDGVPGSWNVLLTPPLINFSSWSSTATNCSSSQLTNNASDAQQRNSAIHIHVSILPQTPPPIQADIQHWAEFPVLYSRTLFAIHAKYSSVYVFIPNSLTLSSPHSSPLATANLFSKSVSLFLFGAVVKTWHFQSRRHRFDPWSRV